jgi:hypothetical protein
MILTGKATISLTGNEYFLQLFMREMGMSTHALNFAVLWDAVPCSSVDRSRSEVVEGGGML